MNAALLVARTLIEGDPNDGPQKARLAEARARYCQLMASRMKLGHILSHRLALAAWLSALEGKDDVLRRLSIEHDLESVLFTQNIAAEDMKAEAQILGLVKCYEMLRKQYPDLTADTKQACSYLRQVLPADAEHKRLLRVFAKILEDEMFLVGTRVAAGRILIVDPEEDVMPVLSPPLISDGYDVRVVATVVAAKAILEEFSPHLIMAEMNMPIDTGIDFCRELKTDPNLGSLPFVMLTSSRGSRTETKCLKAGADEVMTRPVDLEMLFLKLGRMLKIPEKEAGLVTNGVGGSLSDMAFVDIVQIITAGGRSVEISLVNSDGIGLVYIQNGEIIHAEDDGLEGAEAFYALMGWKEGTFTSRQRSDFDKHTIHGTVMGLLMEGARRSDEA